MARRGYCVGCTTKLTHLDDDPNGEHNADCVRCRAESEHDFDAEPNVFFLRDGTKRRKSVRKHVTDEELGRMVRLAMNGKQMIPRRPDEPTLTECLTGKKVRTSALESDNDFFANNSFVTVAVMEVLAGCKIKGNR